MIPITQLLDFDVGNAIVVFLMLFSFAIAVDLSAASRVVGILTQFKNFAVGRLLFLPQRIALIAQGNTASTYTTAKVTVLSAAQIATAYGYGSPAHLAALQLFPKNGDGVGSVPVTLYPLLDNDYAVTAAGNIALTGPATAAGVVSVKISNIGTADVAIASGITADAALALIKTAITAVLEMPAIPGTVLAGDLPFTAKWGGESGNDIYIEVESDVAGFVFVITQPVGGLNNPDVDDALDLIGPVWETMVINALNYDDTTTLDLYKTYGDGRWGALEKKPLLVFSATGDSYAVRSVITDARTTDKINSLIPAPSCRDLPAAIAARAVARIAVQANNNPPVNYSQHLTGITAGIDSAQELYATRDLAVKAGSGTTVLVDGEIELNDTVTMYHPTGEDPPAYRYVVDIVKLMNIIFNLRIIFEAAEWRGAPLLPDATPTINPAAKKPKSAKTALGNLAVNLALAAIISDPDFTKDAMTADISSTNPKRLDIVFPTKLSGNTEIISIDNNFGFFFGEV